MDDVFFQVGLGLIPGAPALFKSSFPFLQDSLSPLRYRPTHTPIASAASRYISSTSNSLYPLAILS